ncbi:hypothetical protein SeKA_B0051 (plasmid) [Salmonella enterica subsp. enterica serovar Kentucky str. CVM29188]|nr:hypothetical protein SeKA_B0051 [Salmonella enterica subsp. enterica serovar Kentucky str. CVM29188]
MTHKIPPNQDTAHLNAPRMANIKTETKCKTLAARKRR